MRERTPFGQRLYEAMTHAKLSQPMLAKAAGVSQGNLGELLWKGNGSMAVVRLAMACGVRPEWLAEGVGAMVDGAGLTPELADLVKAISALPTERQRDFVISTARQALEALAELTEQRNGLAQSPNESEKVLGTRTNRRTG